MNRSVFLLFISLTALANPDLHKCITDGVNHLGDPSETPSIFGKFAISPERAAEARAQVDRKVLDETLFIIPSNDGEARRAVDVLKAARAPHLLESKQGWGAKLENEAIPDPLPPGVKRIAVMEIPSKEVEERLRAKGIEVVVIDHHFYKGNDRTRSDSSLEQLCKLIGWPMDKTDHAISSNDKGYIPAMKAMGLTPREISDVRKYDILAQAAQPVPGKKQRTEADYDKMVAHAHAEIATLKQTGNGVYIVGPEIKDTGILGQELCISKKTGVAHIVEIMPNKIGFSGSPEIVAKLKAVDFTQFGYPKDSYDQYGGGQPPSQFFGFKPKPDQDGKAAPITREVIDHVMKIVESETNLAD